MAPRLSDTECRSRIYTRVPDLQVRKGCTTRTPSAHMAPIDMRLIGNWLDFAEEARQESKLFLEHDPAVSRQPIPFTYIAGNEAGVPACFAIRDHEVPAPACYSS
ncbi:hypothetical protein BJX99DRAFT_100768 [Aspergillus californicus]